MVPSSLSLGTLATNILLPTLIFSFQANAFLPMKGWNLPTRTSTSTTTTTTINEKREASSSISSSISSSALFAVGLGPSTEEDTSEAYIFDPADFNQTEMEWYDEEFDWNFSASEYLSEPEEMIPNHEEHRLDRRSKVDESTDAWFGALLSDHEKNMNLGQVSKDHYDLLTTPVELVNEFELPYDHPDWTPYVRTKLPTSILYPAYGCEVYGIPVPRVKADAWRHFDVFNMIKIDYSRLVEDNGKDLIFNEEDLIACKAALKEQGAWVDDEELTGRMVYINGRYCPQLSMTNDVVYNMDSSFFSQGKVSQGDMKKLQRLTDGFTDELDAPCPVTWQEDTYQTSYKRLSGPDHSVGDPTSQFAINAQMGTAAFCALNSVQAGNVARVDVPDGEGDLDKPVMIVTAISNTIAVPEGDKEGIAFHPRCLVTVGKKSKLSFIQHSIDLDIPNKPVNMCPKFFNGFTQMTMDEDAKLGVSYLEETGGFVTPAIENSMSLRRIEQNRPEMKNTFFDNYDIQMSGMGAMLNLTTASIGAAGFVRPSFHVTQNVPFVESFINGFQIAGGLQCQECRSNLHLIAQQCINEQKQHVMPGGRCQSHFRGRIRVERSCQGLDSDQLARVLMLSDYCKLWVTPALEIIANDIVCSHGVTISDLDEEPLFYIQQRGLDEETARNLLTFGFGWEVCNKLDGKLINAGLQDRFFKRLAGIVPKSKNMNRMFSTTVLSSEN